MIHWFIPTQRNNYKAYLLRTPFMIVLTILFYIFNTASGILPSTKVSAAITTSGLLELHNAERVKAGLPPFKLNTRLTNSAQAKALAMLSTNCWSHYCPEGKSPWEFFNKAGYSYVYAGENLAEGFFDNQDAMIAWMNSPSHRENVLRPDFEDIGFGVVHGDYQGLSDNVIIVVHFGTPQTAIPAKNGFTPDIYDNSLPTPKITSPADGIFTNTPNLHIIGTAPEASEVEVQGSDGAVLGTTITDGDAFDYTLKNLVEKEYRIRVVGKIGTRQSRPSNQVSVTVDTTPDQVDNSQVLVVNKTDTRLNLQIIAPQLREIRMIIDGTPYAGVAENGVWQFGINTSDLEQISAIIVSDVDKAGNTWEGQLATAPLLAQGQAVISENNQILTLSSGFQVTKAGMNVAFLLILILLFGIDFAVLARSGRTRAGAKPHLQFVLFIVAILVVLGGSVVGQVGTGIQL